MPASTSPHLQVAVVVADWVSVAALVAVDAALNVLVHPFKQFVGETTTLDSLVYPFRGTDTVPFWAVVALVFGLPILVFVAHYLFKRTRDGRELHQAIFGLVFAVLVTAVITDALKNAIGQPRPDFFWRCFPDGKAVFENATSRVLCTGNRNDIREGHKSFPSGHASWSFAGMGFLTLYLICKIDFGGWGVAIPSFILLAPLAAATAIAITRLDDYMHRWQDVFIGAILGLFVASISYHQSMYVGD